MLAVTWRGKKRKSLPQLFSFLGSDSASGSCKSCFLAAAVERFKTQKRLGLLSGLWDVLPGLASHLPRDSIAITKTHVVSSSRSPGRMSNCPGLEEVAAMWPLVALTKGTPVPGHPQHKLKGLTQRQEWGSLWQEEEGSGISFSGVFFESKIKSGL